MLKRERNLLYRQLVFVEDDSTGKSKNEVAAQSGQLSATSYTAKNIKSYKRRNKIYSPKIRLDNLIVS